ncbi:hypothetical protein MKZ38_000304 [Zalerion maritima]|uniref:MARVEL domain-containing protein n=1 Tax=Zalerion maritima TaxID=339359 RepID=A0AAD5RSH2_9PEZI|nr:hypothetical protein MKZ38_000304 [Zalerion maritima]
MQAYASSPGAPGQAPFVLPSGPKHFVEPLPYMLICRILQLVFAVLVLGLSAGWLGYLQSACGSYCYAYSSYKDGPPIVFALCCSIFTAIGAGYILAAERSNRSIYNAWAVMSIDFVLAVFWLSSMASNAAVEIHPSLSVFDGLRLGVVLISAFVFVTFVAVLIGTVIHAMRAGVFGSLTAQRQLPPQNIVMNPPQSVAPQPIGLQQNPVPPQGAPPGYLNTSMPGAVPTNMYSPSITPAPQQQIYASMKQG